MVEQPSRLRELLNIITRNGANSLTADQTLEFIALVVSDPDDSEKIRSFYHDQGGKALLSAAISAPAQSPIKQFVRLYLEEKLGISRTLALILTSMPQLAATPADTAPTDSAPQHERKDESAGFSSFVNLYRWQYDPPTAPDDLACSRTPEISAQHVDLETVVWSMFRGSRSERFLLAMFAEDYTFTSCSFVQSGSVSTVSIDIKDIVINAKKNGARFLIAAHNHPSENPVPSRADLNSTRSLFVSMKSIGVTLIDHFIITVTSCTSVRSVYNYFDTTIVSLNEAMSNLSKLEEQISKKK